MPEDARRATAPTANDGSAPPRWGRVLLRSATVVALVIAARYAIDFHQMWRALRGGIPGYFAVALVLAAADRLLMAFKWRQLIVAAGGRVPFAAVASAYFQSTFVGHVIPSAVTSEILRCYVVCRRGVDRSTVLFTMAAERAIGAAATGTLAIAALPVAGVNLARFAELPMVAATLASSAVLGAIAWRMRVRLAAPVIAVATRLLPSRPWEERNLRGVFAVSLALSVAEQLLQVTIVVFVAAALGIVQWTIGFFAALTVITSIRRVVAYIESWGLAEGVVIGLYIVLGIDPSEAAALALATYAVLVMSVLPGGLLLLSTPAAERFTRQRAA